MNEDRESGSDHRDCHKSVCTLLDRFHISALVREAVSDLRGIMQRGRPVCNGLLSPKAFPPSVGCLSPSIPRISPQHIPEMSPRPSRCHTKANIGSKSYGGTAPGSDQDPRSFWEDYLASMESLSHPPGEMVADGEVAGCPAGSWVDPLFRGPAPIVELQGLGDRYRDLSFLGQGSAGRVFRAMDTLLLRPVALKVLKDGSNAALLEARAQAQVEHPNVCRVYEVGRGFIVLQLVEGPSLANMASSMNMVRKIRILRDVARGVHAAHLKGLLHLDLKLDNILIQKGRGDELQPLVSDFGMVRGPNRAVGEGCPMGTPPYTSPEQLQGKSSCLCPATDVYAMGVMLYVLLTGASPFPAQNLPNLLDAMENAVPVPLGKRLPVPKDLACIVHRCLEKDPAARYASAEGLADDLDCFLEGKPVRAMGPDVGYRLRKWLRRNRRLTWVAGLSFLVLAGTAGTLGHHIVFANRQAGWDYRFQKQVEELRTILDRAYRLPEHDIEPELQRARTFLTAIQREMVHEGKASQGPGHLALGQALLVLDPADARAAEHFQRAWDLGYRTEGVKTWLAFTRVQVFEAVMSRLNESPPSAEETALEKSLRKRYLEPAMYMALGQDNADQARLTHLAQMTALSYRGSRGVSDTRLAMVRAYRARFPDDVEALLEEADALADKAAILHAPHGGSQPTDAQAASAAASLRRSAMDLLLQAHRIAPSHPRVYNMLAWFCLDEAIGKAEGPAAKCAPSPAQAEAWIQRGRRVSPGDLGLLWSHLYFASGRFLDVRLKDGGDPEPQVRACAELLETCWTSRDERVFAMALPCSLNLAETFGRYGLRRAELLQQALVHLEHRMNAGSSSNLGDLTSLFRAASYALHAGLDPAPAFRLATHLLASGTEAHNRETVIGLYLLEAETRARRGEDPQPLLDRAGQLIQRFREQGDTRAVHPALCLALLEARHRGGSALWMRVEKAVAETLTLRDEPGLPQLGCLIEAQMELVQWKLRSGQDVRSLINDMRNRVVNLSASKAPSHLRNEWLAELSLLQARVGPDPEATLRRGLIEADRALVYRPVEAESSWTGAPHQSRTWGLKGRLYLALAERSVLREHRRTWACLAEKAFRAALDSNPNLAHLLGADLTRARAILKPNS